MLNSHDSDLSELSLTKTPFDRIGLAFSGGGFRAASFCLGTLSYFNYLDFDGNPMLKRVSYISSASGGTITNSMYALYTAEGKGFYEFYNVLHHQLNGISMLDRVLKILNDSSFWQVGQKRRNMINAFALTYDEKLFAHKTLDALSVNHPNNHLEEICFNTTEFHRGLLFRQTFKMKPDKEEKDWLYGNYIVDLKNGHENKLRLADLLAASSCFPAGFEPIMFPDDFIHEKDKEAYDKRKREILDNLHVNARELSRTELLNIYDEDDINSVSMQMDSPVVLEDLAAEIDKLKLKDDFRFGLMDGGITDNQGIESLILANKRRSGKDITNFKPFDFMFICDVCSHYMEPMQDIVPKKGKGSYGISILTVLVLSSILALVGLGGSIFGWIHDTVWAKVALIISPFLLVVGSLIVLGLFWIRRYVGGKLKNGKGLNLEESFSESIVRHFFKFLKETPIGVIFDMLKTRFNSIKTLNMEVFLKRVRYLLYAQFMTAGRNSFRVKTNHVYDLAFSNDRERLEDRSYNSPSQDMQIVAQYAFNMETTLWFENLDDDKNKKSRKRKEKKIDHRAALIACGQFTTCYNLLEYVMRMKDVKNYGVDDENGGGDKKAYYDTLDDAWKKKVDDVEYKLKADYGKFLENPFWLYNEEGTRIDGFKNATMDQFPFQADFINLRYKLQLDRISKKKKDKKEEMGKKLDEMVSRGR